MYITHLLNLTCPSKFSKAYFLNFWVETLKKMIFPCRTEGGLTVSTSNFKVFNPALPYLSFSNSACLKCARTERSLKSQHNARGKIEQFFHNVSQENFTKYAHQRPRHVVHNYARMSSTGTSKHLLDTTLNAMSSLG